MAIVTKKISGREYAYASMREGKRVITRYIGPAGSPAALKAIAKSQSAHVVPGAFRALFWDTELKNISLRNNARYIIERVLEHGDLEALGWIQRIYTGQRILDVLETSRSISQRSRQFWRIWFGAEAA